MTAERYYASGIAQAEASMPSRKATWTLDAGRPGFHDRDNFTTNRVTIADYMDGAAVSGRCAVGISATWACLNLLAGTQASLPIEIHRSVPGRVDEENWDHPLYRVLAESPNADLTALDFFEFNAAALELHGNAYAEVERAARGDVVALGEPLAPESVTVRRAASGSLEYEWNEGGRRRVVPQDRMLHVRGFGATALGGMSTLSWCRRTFSAAIAIETASANTFQNGVRASGAFAAEHLLTPEQMVEAEARIQEKYAGAMNAGRPLLLNAGMKWQAITINPEDAQMLESRNFSVEEICRLFQVPPHLIGHTAGNTQLGSSIEQQTLAFQIFTLRRRLKRFEQSINKQLLTAADRARGLNVKFNIRGLMRADSKARAEFYASALQNGWMTINEVRELEGLPPVPGGDVPRMQKQNVPIAETVGLAESLVEG